jgi:hypothetical protein
MTRRNLKSNRTGGVYIAVLGSALIVGLLGMSALVGQRIENRAVVASADIRQAQLNANTAIEMGLLAMKQESNWRTARTNGAWFASRDTGAGTCRLEVIDPLDGNLANDPDDPVVMVGVGYRGHAEQRVKLTVEPQSQALSSLRSAIAAGQTINVDGHTLRTDGLITANTVSASGAQVYGDVEAVAVSGSIFTGTTQQVDTSKLPIMPNWSTVFQHYANSTAYPGSNGLGTQIPFGNIPPVTSIELVQNHNWNVESGVTFWFGTQPGASTHTATVTRSTVWSRTGGSLRVASRSSWEAGAIQRIEHFVKPNHQYDVRVWVRPDSEGLLNFGSRQFQLTFHVKGTADATESVSPGVTGTAGWLTVAGIGLIVTEAQINGRVTAPPWSGDLEYAFVKISDASSSGGTGDFFVDDLSIREFGTGRRIYRRVLGPGTGGGLVTPPNPQGLYWIDCGGQRLTIERSRIVGTLLLINPGPGSGITEGPIHWTPYVAGYPALLVDASDPATSQFHISYTRRVLSEAEQRVDFNPAGAPYEQLPSDGTRTTVYPSVIHGLVVVEGDLAYQNRPFVRGQLLVGGNIAKLPGQPNVELDVDYQVDSLLNPPPGFLAPHTHARRPGSVAKAVLP